MVRVTTVHCGATEFIDEAKKANIRAQQLLKQRGSLLPEKSTSEATAGPV